jgi:hypothetical protein
MLPPGERQTRREYYAQRRFVVGEWIEGMRDERRRERHRRDRTEIKLLGQQPFPEILIGTAEIPGDRRSERKRAQRQRAGDPPERVTRLFDHRDPRRRRLRPGELAPGSSPPDGPSVPRSMRTTGRMTMVALAPRSLRSPPAIRSSGNLITIPMRPPLPDAASACIEDPRE